MLNKRRAVTVLSGSLAVAIIVITFLLTDGSKEALVGVVGGGASAFVVMLGALLIDGLEP